LAFPFSGRLIVPRQFARLARRRGRARNRLSGEPEQENVTLIDALADVCAAFRWVREHADELGVDRRRVAGFGVSAGGHLVASAATLGCPKVADTAERSGPDALLLWSPALDLADDAYFKGMLQGRAATAAYSPVEHVTAKTPPTSIVQGAKDTMTPLAGAKRYCHRLSERGVVCELNVYPGLGHLLTRNLAEQDSQFDPDPNAAADGFAKHRRFLVQLGFLPD
jgi:acetyl esterase